LCGTGDWIEFLELDVPRRYEKLDFWPGTSMLPGGAPLAAR